MPSIRKNEAQAKALDEINDALNTIRALNAILVSGWQGGIIISYDTGETGRNKFVKLNVSAKDNEREHAALVKMAQNQKSRLVKAINSKSQKFAIKLDKDDKVIMGPADAAIRNQKPVQPEGDDGDEEMDMDTEIEGEQETGPADFSDDDEGPYEEGGAEAADPEAY